MTSAAGCISVLTLPLFAAGIKDIPYHLIFEGVLFHRIRFRAFMFLSLKVLGLGRVFKVEKLNSIIDRAKAAFAIHLQSLDELLKDGRPWIVGEQFTLADVSWMVLFDRMFEADWFEHFLGGQEFPHVQAYWQRLKTRPSYRDAVDSFRHPLVTAATRRIQQLKSADPQFKAAAMAGCPVISPAS